MIPEKGLVIGPKWAELIVSGEKSWELRKRATKIRGDIGIIAQGTGTIVGTARIVDCIGPLGLDELMAGRQLACETEAEIVKDVEDGYVYAWVVDNAVKFEKPVPYKHPSGAVTWVDLKSHQAGFNISAAKPTAGEDFDRVGGQLSAQTLQKGAAAYNALNYTFQACAASGAVLGEAIVTQNWGKLEVDLMHVDEAHRGQGVGKALLKAVEDFARANDLKAIRLNTPTWQGVGFYERAGFTEMGRIPLQKDANGTTHFEVTYFKILDLK